MIEMPLNQLHRRRSIVRRLNSKFDAAKGKLTIDAAVGRFGLLPTGSAMEAGRSGRWLGFKCFVATCGDRGIDNDFATLMTGSFAKARKKREWTRRYWYIAKSTRLR